MYQFLLQHVQSTHQSVYQQEKNTPCDYFLLFRVLTEQHCGLDLG